VAVTGVIAGWIAWQGRAELATRVRNAASPVATLLSRRYFIDDIYQWGINNVVLGISTIISWFDRVIVNDTGVDGSAGLSYFTGYELKFTETGRLPNYALGIAAGVIIIGVLLLVFEVKI
jgi:NADH-quinone oxidoreductase subunit L